MKELVRKIVHAIVDYPEEVDIEEIKGLNTVILEIKVSKRDVGKLLGRKGRTLMKEKVKVGMLNARLKRPRILRFRSSISGASNV